MSALHRGPIQTTVEEKLRSAFAPELLEVVNESHMHSVPPGSESHFKVTLVSAVFEGLRQVKRHQTIYQILTDELAGPVHALALHTYTPAEWSARAAPAPASPGCLGGSKHDR